MRAQECEWKVIVEVEPDQIEDLSDLRKLMRTDAKPEVKPRLPLNLATTTALAVAARSSKSVVAPSAQIWGA